MTSKRKLRFYCDFCKKSGGGSTAMKLHEKHCTANPNRECRVCKKAVHALDFKAWMNGVEPAWDEINEDKGVKLFCDGCPACMLSVIRLNKISSDFDFKTEMEAWWEKENKLDRIRDEYDAMHSDGWKCGKRFPSSGL